MEAEKLITVTGRGNIHIVPDVTRVEVTIDSIFRSYDTAYQMAETNLKDIGEVLRQQFTDSNIIGRVEDDNFIVFVKDCPDREENLAILKLRQTSDIE